MKHLLLCAAFIMAGISANAKEGFSELKSTFAPRGYGAASEVDHVCFFSSIAGLYASTQKTFKSTAINGSGFGVMVELGAKVPIRVGNARSNNFLSFSLAYQLYAAKETYTDAALEKHTDKYTYTSLGLPISFTSLHNGRGNTGFYWQAGININYMGDVRKGSSEKVTNDYNHMSIMPFAGFGLSFDQQIVKGPYTGTLKGMVGPFISYCPTNMAATSGVSMHNYIIGLQMSGIRLGS